MSTVIPKTSLEMEKALVLMYAPQTILWNSIYSSDQEWKPRIPFFQ